MQSKVLGVQRLDFQTETGSAVKGVKLHCMFPDENVEGFAVDSFFVNADSILAKSAESLTPNADVDLTFNRRGRLAEIKPIISNAAAKA